MQTAVHYPCTHQSVHGKDNKRVAEQGLPTKAIGRWFPYVASLMLFIWVVNMIGFIPLPISSEKFELFGIEFPTFAIYAACERSRSQLLITNSLFCAWAVYYDFPIVEGYLKFQLAARSVHLYRGRKEKISIFLVFLYPGDCVYFSILQTPCL
jgi:hypothetical protein